MAANPLQRSKQQHAVYSSQQRMKTIRLKKHRRGLRVIWLLWLFDPLMDRIRTHMQISGYPCVGPLGTPKESVNLWGADLSYRLRKFRNGSQDLRKHERTCCRRPPRHERAGNRLISSSWISRESRLVHKTTLCLKRCHLLMQKCTSE